MNTREKIVQGIKGIEDPEIGLDIYTLGLIYKIEVQDKHVDLDMTFTSPTCPYGPELLASVEQVIRELGLEPRVELVFSPLWKPSEEVKIMLGLA